MIITKKFVFVHIPKTGGSWVRKVIEESHKKIFRRTPLGRLVFFISKFVPSAWGNKLNASLAVSSVVSLLKEKNDASFLLNFNFKYYNTKKWLILILKRLGFFNKNIDQCFLCNLYSHPRYAILKRSFYHLPVIACMRDPFTWHVSRYNYELGIYKKKIEHYKVTIFYIMGKEFSFAEYCQIYMMRLQNMYYQGYRVYMFDGDGTKEPRRRRFDEIHFGIIYQQYGYNFFAPPIHYGLFTFVIIIMLFKRPLEVLKLPPKEFEKYFTSGAYKNNMPKITFLETEGLNQAFTEFLLKHGYKQKYIKHIPTTRPINTSMDSKYTSFYDNEEQIKYIYKLERALFIMFPHYEKKYKKFLEAVKKRNS